MRWLSHNTRRKTEWSRVTPPEAAPGQEYYLSASQRHWQSLCQPGRKALWLVMPVAHWHQVLGLQMKEISRLRIVLKFRKHHFLLKLVLSVSEGTPRYWYPICVEALSDPIKCRCSLAKCYDDTEAHSGWHVWCHKRCISSHITSHLPSGLATNVPSESLIIVDLVSESPRQRKKDRSCDYIPQASHSCVNS